MEIRNLRITKRGKTVGGIFIGVTAVVLIVLAAVAINGILNEHKYVMVRYASVEGDLWKVRAQTDASIIKVSAKSGDAVKKGDSLVVLSNNSMNNELRIEETELSRLKDLMVELRKGASRKQLYDAIQQVNAAKELLSQFRTSRSNLQNSSNVIKNSLYQVNKQLQPYVSPNTHKLDEAYALSQVKTAYLDNQFGASDYLIRMNTLQRLFALKTQLELQDLQLRSELGNLDASVGIAENQMIQAEKSYRTVQEGASLVEITLLADMIKSVEANVNILKLKLAGLTIKAPQSGTVMASYGHVGDTAVSGETIATIMDLSKLFVIAYIDQRDLKRVKIGQSVSLKQDKGRTTAFSGKVKRIGYATLGVYSLNDENPSVSTYDPLLNGAVPVEIVVEGKAVKLTPGMALVAKIKAIK